MQLQTVNERIAANEERLKELHAEKERRLQDEEADGGFVDIVGGTAYRSVTAGKPQADISAPSGIEGVETADREIQNLLAENDLLTEARRTLEAQRTLKKSDGWLNGTFDIANNARNFVRGVKDQLKDADMYANGVMALQRSERLGKLKEKLERGGELTDSELSLAYSALLHSRVMSEADLPHAYTAGQTITETAPFIAQMVLNPASGLGKALIKRFGKSGLRKALAAVAGDVAEAAVLANTLQAPATVADIRDRHRGEIAVEGGEYAFKGGESLGKAIAKGQGAQIIENYTELLGAHFGKIASGLGRGVAKGAKKAGLGKAVETVSGLVNNIKATDWAKAVANIEKRAQWNGTFGEILEEEAGIVLNSLFVGDNSLSDLGDSEQQIDIVLGVGLFGGFVSGIKTAGYPVAKKKADNRLRTRDNIGRRRFGDGWGGIKDAIENAEDKDVSKTVTDLIRSHALSGEQARSIVEYAYALQQSRGYALSEQSRGEESDTRGQTMLNAAFEEGYEADSPDALVSAMKSADDSRQRLVNELGSIGEDALETVMEEIERDPVLALSHTYDNALRDAMLDYANAKGRLDGVRQRVTDDTDAMVNDAIATIDDRTNRYSGDVIQVRIGVGEAGDVAAYVVNGNLAVFDDGTVDIGRSDDMLIIRYEDGKLGHVSPDEISAVESVADPGMLKREEENRIRSGRPVPSYSETVGDTPSTPAFGVGQRLTFKDKRFTDAEIVEINDDGVVVEYSYDGQRAVRQIPQTDLLRMVENGEKDVSLPIENKHVHDGNRPEQDTDGISSDDSSGVAGDAARSMEGNRDRSHIRVYEEGLPLEPNGDTQYGERTRRESEVQRLTDIARQNGQYIEKKDFVKLGKRKHKPSGESIVYDNHEKDGKVYKIKDPYAKSPMKGNVQPEDAIYEHLVHNKYFPETAYGFEGISDEAGDLRIVLSQDYVEAADNATEEQIEAALAEKGLLPEGRYAYGNEEITVTDVAGDNALLGADGKVYFIDPIINFKKPVREILGEASERSQPVDYAPQTALSQIPMSEDADGKMQPQWTAVDAGLAWDAIVEKLNGNEDTAKKYADHMTAYARQRLAEVKQAQEKAAKGKINITDIDAFAAEEERKKQELAAADRELAQWIHIARVKQDREAVLRKQEQERRDREAAELWESQKAQAQAATELQKHEEIETSESIGKTMDTDDNPTDLRGDTALSQNSNVSDSKYNDSEYNKQVQNTSSTPAVIKADDAFEGYFESLRENVVSQALTPSVMARRKTEDAAQGPSQYAKVYKNWDAPASAEEWITRALSSSGQRIKWSGPHNLAAQIYGREDMAEKRDMLWIISDRNGMGFEAYVHKMWEQLVGDNGAAFNRDEVTDQDVRNLVIDLLRSYPTSRNLYDHALEMQRKREDDNGGVADRLAELEHHYQEIRDDWYRERFGMTADEYTDAEEVAYNEIRDNFLTDADVREIANQTIDEYYAQRQQQQQLEAANQGGDTVLPRQLPDDRGGSAPPTGGRPEAVGGTRLDQSASASGTDSTERGRGTAQADRGNQSSDTQQIVGRNLTNDEAASVIAKMESNAAVAPDIELTPENWYFQFGEDGIVETPLGKVKMGDNQLGKLILKKRTEYFGMIHPTLISPDVIIEKIAPAESAERNTKYLFVKTFVKPDGSRIVHFESITVQKDGMEVSISSHEAEAKSIKKEMQSGKILHLSKKLSPDSERYLTEASTAPKGPDLVPTSDNISSDDKDNAFLPNKQGNAEESSTQPAESESAPTIQATVVSASAEVNTEPTPAQAEAGNYKKGHVTIGKFDITIENPAGSTRKGVDADGKEWQTTMANAYGYIKGTEGVDGDHIDVFLHENMDEWNGRKVFVVDQTNPDGSFDEHKVMLGFNDKDDAMTAYLANYQQGWSQSHPGLRISEVNIEDFNKWVQSSHRKTKPFADYSSLRRSGKSMTTVSKITDATPTEQSAAISGNGYSAVSKPYTNRQGKTLDTYLVSFNRDFSKEEMSALRAKAKALKGWYDRETKGWMLRSQEDAKAFADDIVGKSEDEVADDAPLSMADMEKPIEALVKKVDVNRVANALKARGETRLSDHAEPVGQPKAGSAETSTKHRSKWVDDEDAEEFARLREEMRKSLGQLNVGLPLNLIPVGAKMTYLMMKHGVRKFGEYAHGMVEELGDAIRPHLKSLYEFTRAMSEVQESGWVGELTPHEEVMSFDTLNFDKPGAKDIIATAQHIVNEQSSQQQTEQIIQTLTDQRNNSVSLSEEQPMDDLFGGLFDTETIQNQNNGKARNENTGADNSGTQPERKGLPASEQMGTATPVQDSVADSQGERRRPGLGSRKSGTRPQYDVTKDYTNEEIHAIASSVAAIKDGKVVITGDVTDEIRAICRQYKSGGIAKKGRGVLDEYYTDGKIVDAVSMLIAPYFNGKSGVRVLEPSVGIGNFIEALQGIPTSEVQTFEINETTARIAKILHPDVEVNLRSFETEFIDESGDKKPLPKKFSLIIGNPPYGSHRGFYKGLGEESKIARYEDYFVKRSLDILEDGGVLAMVLPSSWIDRHTVYGGYTVETVYRLPSGAFEATKVGTDIVILRKNSSVPVSDHAPYFEQHPENICGEVKQRKGRFGKMEEYVEGSIDAAIEKIERENAKRLATKLGIESTTDNLNEIQSAIEETCDTDKAASIIKEKSVEKDKDGSDSQLTSSLSPNSKGIRYKVELNKGGEVVPTSLQFQHSFSDGEIAAFEDTNYDGVLDHPSQHSLYANYIGGKLVHDFYYAEGDIYSKLEQLEQDKASIIDTYGEEQYEKQKNLLESVLPKLKGIDEITISPNTTFVKNIRIHTPEGPVPLRDMFIDFCRKLPYQAFGSSSSWEVVGYVQNEQVYGQDKQRNQLVRERRKRVANDLFVKFLNDVLSEEERRQIVYAFNREYNSTYRPDYSKVPMFSTINKDFKGKPLKLTSVQLAGVGRMTVKGVGVLAHEVGFGKTLSGVLAMHEAMTRGFAKKPLIVVPNDNILKQWVETIGEVLPHATVNMLGNLGASYDLTGFHVNDFEFTIVTYEGLKAMSFSDDTYNRLSDRFSYITEDLKKHQSERDAQKKIEKRKELKGKMKRGAKPNYMFEDFGFDYLTFDEVHNANHIVSKVRLDKSIASDFRSQSQRTSDLGLKTWIAAQYIQEMNDGRNVLLLSATPFTNKPLEYYSILSLVGNDMLARKGFFNVDQFFATFMEADNELGIGANGRPIQKTNVRKFRNNGLFQQLLSEFIDIKGEEDNPDLERPERHNREYRLQQNGLTTDAIAAAQDLLSDNDTVLQGIGHARAAAFSPYATSLLGLKPKNHKDFVENSPKIDATVRMIEQNMKDRPDAGQIVYSEVGVEFFPLIRDYLVRESGFKPEEVRIITGATSNAERVNIQTAFNKGEVKVVIGSPAIKEGLNLQGNTTDMYILSLPWNFTQLRQIEGRGWRQGNRWNNIRINYMLTDDSVDVFMLQRLQTKQGLYNEAMKRGAESVDVSDIDTSELKTALITDPAVRAEIVTMQERAKLNQEKIQIEADLAFVMRKYKTYNDLVNEADKDKSLLKRYTEYAQKEGGYWLGAVKDIERTLVATEKKIEQEKQKLLEKGIDVDDIVRQTEESQNSIKAIDEKIEHLEDFEKELADKYREENQAQERGDSLSSYLNERKKENQGGFYSLRKSKGEELSHGGNEGTASDTNKYRDSDGDRLLAIRALAPIEVEANEMDRQELFDVYRGLREVYKDGKNIRFLRATFGKNYKVNGLFSQVVPYLDEVLENSVFAYSESDMLGGMLRPDGTQHKSHPNIETFDNYVGKIRLGKTDYYVRLTVQNTLDDTTGVHSCFVSNVELYDKTALTGTDTTIFDRPNQSQRGVVDAKLQQFFERASSELLQNDMKQRVTELSDKLNTPVRIVGDVNELTSDNAERQARMRRSKGFYDPATGEVVIVLPNHADVADIENTIVHEIVGHDGLRAFIGEERLDEFLDEVYDHAGAGIRRAIDGRTQKMVDNEAGRLTRQKGGGVFAAAEARIEAEEKRDQYIREATEEYMADMAGRIGDKGFEAISREEMTLWDRIKTRVMQLLDRFLRGHKIAKSIRLTDKDLAYILYKSWRRKRGMDGVIAKAEDIAMRHMTGYDEPKNSEHVLMRETNNWHKKMSSTNEAGLNPIYPSDAEHEAKVAKKIGIAQSGLKEVARKYSATNDPKQFLTDLKIGLGIETTKGSSGYQSFELSDGRAITVRVSNHNANSEYSNEPMISIVVKRRQSPNTFRQAEGHEVHEYVYFRDELQKAPTGTLSVIAESLSDMLNSGQYVDRTGLARENHSDLRFRDVEDFADDLDISLQDRAIVRDAYNKMCASGSFQFREAVQDSMNGLKALYRAVLGDKMRIEDVPTFENAYLYENRMSSANQAQQYEYSVGYMRPLIEEIHKIAGADKKARQALSDYLMAKHGLERNEYMRKVAASKKEETDRDFAGLTALTGETDWIAAEEIAREIVSDYESAHDTAELWMRINAATAATLDKMHSGGLLSNDAFEKIRSMYKYYVPLRGWEETTSEEVYGYLTAPDGPMNGNIMKKTKGRSSKADDPVATIAKMAEDAIRQANRNTMKQRFLNFVLNHPSDAVSVNSLWLAYDETAGEWRPVFADLKESDTSEEVERKVAAFEKRMEELSEKEPDRYKRGEDAADIPFRVLKANMREHQAIVLRNGVKYVLTINGNPRAAQAINGLTNPDVDVNGVVGNILKGAERVNRELSACYTTRNPDFVVGNFLRDTIYANTMVWVKETPGYAAAFNKNWAVYNAVYMVDLFNMWRKGTLDMADDDHRLFYEFMVNGGETGYTSVKDIDRHKKTIAKLLRQQEHKALAIWSTIGANAEVLSRAVENGARFAAYATSRQMGRSVERSVYDAKEISVNFNKKGSGGKMVNATGQTILGKTGAYVGGMGRTAYVFFNAAVQGSANFGRAAKHHPAKAVAAVATMFTLGYLAGLSGYMSGSDDDDDMNSYYNLPSYVRRGHFCIWAGKQWVTLPLPPEYRAIYGLGELLYGVMSGNERYSTSELAYEIAAQFSQLLPLDLLGDGGGMSAFIPSLAKPIVEAAMNKSWTGLPIYRETPFNEDDPEWKKAYKNTDKRLVAMTKWLNEVSGGNDYKSGWLDWNPAIIEHILKGYLGGLVSFPGKIVKTAETIAGDREFEWRNIPLANRVIKAGDERTEARRLRNEYFKYSEERDTTAKLLRKYSDDSDKGIIKYAELLSFLYYSDEYLRYEIFEMMNGEIETYDEMIKLTADDDLRKEAESLRIQRMRELVNAMRNPKAYLEEHGIVAESLVSKRKMRIDRAQAQSERKIRRAKAKATSLIENQNSSNNHDGKKEAI